MGDCSIMFYLLACHSVPIACLRGLFGDYVKTVIWTLWTKTDRPVVSKKVCLAWISTGGVQMRDESTTNRCFLSFCRNLVAQYDLALLTSLWTKYRTTQLFRQKIANGKQLKQTRTEMKDKLNGTAKKHQLRLAIVGRWLVSSKRSRTTSLTSLNCRSRNGHRTLIFTVYNSLKLMFTCDSWVVYREVFFFFFRNSLYLFGVFFSVGFAFCLRGSGNIASAMANLARTTKSSWASWPRLQTLWIYSCRAWLNKTGRCLVRFLTKGPGLLFFLKHLL